MEKAPPATTTTGSLLDLERKEELILAKQVRQGTVVIQGGANILRDLSPFVHHDHVSRMQKAAKAPRSPPTSVAPAPNPEAVRKASNPIALRYWSQCVQAAAPPTPTDQVAEVLAVGGQPGGPITAAASLFRSDTSPPPPPFPIALSALDRDNSSVQRAAQRSAQGRGDAFLLNNPWVYTTAAGLNSSTHTPSTFRSGGPLPLGEQLVAGRRSPTDVPPPWHQPDYSLALLSSPRQAAPPAAGRPVSARRVQTVAPPHSSPLLTTGQAAGSWARCRSVPRDHVRTTGNCGGGGPVSPPTVGRNMASHRPQDRQAAAGAYYSATADEPAATRMNATISPGPFSRKVLDLYSTSGPPAHVDKAGHLPPTSPSTRYRSRTPWAEVLLEAAGENNNPPPAVNNAGRTAFSTQRKVLA